MTDAMKITTCKHAYIYNMGVELKTCQWATDKILPPIIKETSIRGISDRDCERCKCWEHKDDLRAEIFELIGE